MARKAVQGYPEKSYYDNTRYLGIVATTDPLNEGLFKHMVNFDVSDTGQSVEPRDGFLTTTFKNGINIITVSNKSIIFKDNNVNEYVIYDLFNNVGYLANISAYNILEKYLPITQLIETLDWTPAVNFLVSQITFIKNFYNAVTGDTTVKYTATRDYIRQYLKIIEDTKVNHIYDENGISKTLIRVHLEAPNESIVKFILQMYYRKDPVTLNNVVIESGNTLNIEVVDTFNHPTLATTDRNLAVSKSIIPEVFQTLYTTANRPDGHLSNLGTFVYVYDEAFNYVNNFIFRNTNYNVKPYFTLNPAYLDLNSAPESNDKWAYRFDIFNSSTEITDNTIDVIHRSSWMKYEGVNTEPEEIFTNLRRNQISLGNAERTLNHYQDSRFVIYVFPKVLGTTTSKTVKTNGVVVTANGIDYSDTSSTGTYEGTPAFSNFTTIQNDWISELNDIKDIRSLITVLSKRTTSNDAFSNSLFYVYDLQSPPSTGIFKALDDAMSNNTDASSIKRFDLNKPGNNKDADYSIFLKANQLVDLIKTNNIFTNSNIVFKLLPYGSNHTHTLEDNRYTFTTNSLFSTQTPIYYYRNNNNIPTFTGYGVGTKIQNVFNSRVYEYQAIDPTTDTWVLVSGTTTSSLPWQFFENEYYFDTRRTVWYQWKNSTQVSPFQDFIGSFTLVTTTVDKPLTVVTNQWSFATLNFWSPTNSYITYVNKYNAFLESFFGFYKKNLNTNQYSVEFDLNTLKNLNTEVPITFTSSERFGNQPPYYRTTIPGATVNADVNTIIHRSSTGLFYRQTADPSGNVWVVVSEDDNGSVIFPTETVPLLPNGFIKNKLYYDTRTNRTYQWKNNDGYNGILTLATGLNTGILETRGFFDKGLIGIFYMRPYKESEFLNIQGTTKNYVELETLKQVWNSTSRTQSFNLTYGFDNLTVTYIQKTLTKEPLDIADAQTLSVFEDTQLLTWYNNVLYISEPGKYYWFKATKKIEFAEEIVKVLQYKQIILVFTTQHLYAVYRVETISTQLNTATNQLEQNVTGVAWLKQIVLYNLLVNKDYKDVIQIFNQMVLFYSEDGQLFMIRPSNTIDSETRFSIQYFNKAVNDILKNYDVYINERLASYGSSMRVKRNEIKIKALVSINFIKLIYYVPGVITYMLIYDVINNRYTAYDSLTFTNIFDKWFIESGDLLVTEQNSKLYFTVPYNELNVKDGHADISFINNFKKESINCLIDTGNMNLNNHLFKRFRDLHVTFKNLNATDVLFNLETIIDEIIARPFYSEVLTVQEINGASYVVPVPKYNNNDLVNINDVSETANDVLKYSLTNNLFEDNNVLMDFSEYTSSKLLTHRTSILGLGKVFRLKLQFVSKGLYKLQNFGIIYKERRI